MSKSLFSTDPRYIAEYRERTINHKPNGAFISPQICSKCKQTKRLAGGSRKIGKSRFDPTVFICKECLANA